MIYNLTQFGEMFKALRTAKGYSYNSLSEASNIAKNTLRNIERGKVLPNIDTLSILSDYLNVDLTTLFLSCKEHHYSQYETMRKDFESMIAAHKTDKLVQYIEIIESLLSDTYGKDSESQLNLKLQQLSYRMTGQYETLINGSHDAALKAFTNGLKITIPNFTIETYKHYNYNYDELIILFNIVQVFGRMAVGDHYLDMYRFIYDSYTNLVETEIYLFPTLVNNMAVIHLEKGNLAKALYYVNEGLAYVNKEQVTIDLPALILCKGIILYHMNNDDHHLYITSAMNLLTLTNRQDIIALAKADMKAKHNIDYSVYLQTYSGHTHPSH